MIVMTAKHGDDATRGMATRWFAALMYLVAGLATLILAVVFLGFDHGLSRAWFNPGYVTPYSFTAVFSLWVLAGLAFCCAAVLTLRWRRVAAVTVGVAWVVGLLAPLLTPMWQRAHQPSALLPFVITWLVPFVPLGIGVAYGVFLRPMVVSDGTSA